MASKLFISNDFLYLHQFFYVNLIVDTAIIKKSQNSRLARMHLCLCHFLLSEINMIIKSVIFFFILSNKKGELNIRNVPRDICLNIFELYVSIYFSIIWKTLVYFPDLSCNHDGLRYGLERQTNKKRKKKKLRKKKCLTTSKSFAPILIKSVFYYSFQIKLNGKYAKHGELHLHGNIIG